MATTVNLSSLFDSLSNSLSSAIEATPKLAGIESIENGVSLLDVKNELLLSYLQNLVFLILIKIRNAKSDDAGSSDNSGEISDAVVKKLVELRLYLDKGVRPLEERLRFQLDKIIRAADDADRSEKMANDTREAESESESDENSDEEADGDDGELDDRARRRADAKQGPSFANFSAPVSVGMAAAATQDKTGVYRPPKITPVVMPTTERRERTERRPMKSATMNEYIADELSTAPSALPSVGSNVTFGGRKVKTTSEREEEQRRQEFEETNFIRLPKEGKKQRAEKNKQERRSAKMSFGGEEWRDLGEGVDRINKLTRQREGGGRSTKALLEKSRKRGRETTDSNRGSGLNSDTREIGERFSKKVKVMEGGRRDRGKR
ncbi:Sas10/Utp3/C1D family protein [Xylaria bambusicola]|uniref:Sas10/Utp3/C1D family protein n=1 Tax=Xylaria bambusicola TaxID=326684 RepID=UPI002007C66C|nr:Sas10/Utp3/C1D family protein [Xylaria bambusicola]KAI0521408.1 Sas10/Utp3/C1D family protein [Xylaria bambusicola]